jgi:hypothetical protein
MLGARLVVDPTVRMVEPLTADPPERVCEELAVAVPERVSVSVVGDMLAIVVPAGTNGPETNMPALKPATEDTRSWFEPTLTVPELSVILPPFR